MGRLINKLPGISSDEIEPLLVSIRRLIFKTLELTVNYPVKKGFIYPNPFYDLFAKLVNDLNDGGREKRCSVITFNYDVALDYALHFNEHPADYCLSEPQKRGLTSLMKLHGSLNWAKCPKCGEIIPWDFGAFFKKFMFSRLDGRTKFAWLPVASKLSSSGLKHCKEDIIPDPVIVPPTWNKTAYHQGLSKVWARAASELSDAENIFVSGYSLIESDSFFRYLFALGSVGKTRIKRFWVFDPDEQEIVRPRFEKLIGSGTRSKFKFKKQAFGEAITSIANEFPSKRR